jgi:hypothetical protein
MIFRGLLSLAALVVLGACSTQPARDADASAEWPEQTKKLFWDLRYEGDVQVLSLAVDEGQYPHVPDTFLDLACRPAGKLAIGSIYIGSPTDVSGVELPTGAALTTPTRRYEGTTEWRKGGTSWGLRELLVSVTDREMAELLSTSFCVALKYPSFESPTCFRPPPPAITRQFLAHCRGDQDGPPRSSPSGGGGP